MGKMERKAGLGDLPWILSERLVAESPTSGMPVAVYQKRLSAIKAWRAMFGPNQITCGTAGQGRVLYLPRAIEDARVLGA